MEHESPFILQEEPDALLRYPQKQKQGTEQGNRTLKGAAHRQLEQETGAGHAAWAQDKE